MKRATLILVALGLCSGGVGQARGEFITFLFNTGVDSTGTPLSDGTVGDPHYLLTSVPLGSTTDTLIRTAAGFPINVYLGDDSKSAWIGPNNDYSFDSPTGLYDYRTTFDLSGLVPSTASILGQWAVDNEGIDILINGASTGNTIGTVGDPLGVSFNTWTSFDITGGFVEGVNTLDFLVYNDFGPTALRVEMTGTASTVPEPDTLTLCCSAIFGMAGFGWWRRKLASA